jgi:hypothetical protein
MHVPRSSGAVKQLPSTRATRRDYTDAVGCVGPNNAGEEA